MIFAVTHQRDDGAIVLSSHRFAFMARIAASWWKATMPYQVLEIAQVTTDPQTIIRICEHRDKILAQHIELALAVEQQRGSPPPPRAVQALWALVARDEVGRWTTVFDADTVVDEPVAEILDEVLA